MRTLYLSYPVVLDAYQRNVAKGNVSFQCLDEKGLRTLLDELRDDVRLPEMPDKLAYLIYTLCEHHFFTDGNKRAAIVIGALMIQVNGYAFMLERYMQVMQENIESVCTERIGKILFKEMMSSILNGEDDFDDMLKLRLLMAIDEEWARADNAVEDGYEPYFEKQYKESQRADNWNSVDGNCAKYPCLKLVFNHNWNDFDFYTWFCLWYVDEDERVRIGDIKIMHKDDDVYDRMPESFTELDESFCSVGMNSDFYKKLKNTLGIGKAKCVLHSLRDCATNDLIYEAFSGHKIFINSLMRDLSTEQARKDAKFLIEDRNLSEAYSFVYNFVPIYNQRVSAKWNLCFDYESIPYKRTYAVIGENGVGKTQMMASLVRDLVSSGAPNLSKLPLLSGVMVICSSVFDAYWSIESANQQMPLSKCCLVQSDNTSAELEKSMHQILDRGTYYNNGEAFMMWEHYEKLLCEQLGKEVADAVLGKEYKEENGHRQVIKAWVKTVGLQEVVNRLSTGQLQIFSLITHVCAHIHLNTLFIIDEPEVHLHPRLVTNFFVMLNTLLVKFESYAIISTHSPLVIRECVQQNVYVMKRTEDNIPLLSKVPYRTFGEDLTILYQKVFENDERNSYFYRTVKEKSMRRKATYEKVVSELEGNGIELTLNSRTVIRDCFDDKESNCDL